MTLADAQRIAEALQADLAPYCDGLEVAGSIRRECPHVKDIEICAVPKRCDIPSLFSKPGRSVSLYDHVSRHYYPIKPGTPRIQPWGITPKGKYWRLALFGDENHPPTLRPLLPTPEQIRSGHPPIKVDLFLPTPETWGMIYLIRTGSANFVKALVTSAHRLGLMSYHGRLCEARFNPHQNRMAPVMGGKVYSTYTEEAVFRTLQLPYIEPRDRYTDYTLRMITEKARTA